MTKKKTPKKTMPSKPAIRVSGSELIRNMALQALNQTGRDRQAARRKFKQWLTENDDLMEAVAGPAITFAITAALSHDIQIERKDILRGARSLPIVENAVHVGRDSPRAACIPVPSAEASTRAAARVVGHHMKLSGFHAYPLPVTGKPLGTALAFEVKEASLYHGERFRGDFVKAQFFAFAWQALPDKDKPAAQQRPVAEHLDLNTLRILDERAQLAGEKSLLEAVGQ